MSAAPDSTGRSPRVLLATCTEPPESAGDDAGLVDALAELGIAASWAPWDDPGADFAGADLAVLRSTWDYTRRRAEFLAWCESVPALANPARVVRWNTDKNYLLDLAAQGVGVVPSEVIAPGQRPDGFAAMAGPGGEFVIKPAVGAGSRDAARFGHEDDEAARAHVNILHSQGRTAVLQPYQPAVDLQGETAVVFLGGVYSHGFVKGPMLASASANGERAPEGVRPAEPGGAQRRAAEDTLDAACSLLDVSRRDLLYARADLVGGASGEPLVLELELSEPSLGFRQTGADAAHRFASAVRAALSR